MTHPPQQPGHPEPDAPDVGRFGMWLFLAALTMLFAAGMLGYIFVRTQLLHPNRPPNPPLGTLGLPWGLWLSTFGIVGSSLALHQALRLVRADRLPAAGRMMVVSLALAIAFIAIQAPCLWALVAEHQQMRQQNVFLYALMAMLIVVHALHVVGGIIPLALTTRSALAGRYTASAHRPLSHMTMYWHFIDIVWLIMFTAFLLIG
jgi:cytochrome c oxidase subunit 3